MKTYLIVGILAATGLSAKTPYCGLTVRVVNNAGVSAGMFVTAAKMKAGEMFERAGVDVRMRDNVSAGKSGTACGALIVVQIEKEDGYSGHESALAYAMPFKNSGTTIHVFLDRVAQLGREPGLQVALLAHVMVHEITHMLQGLERHSAEGVMKARWSRDDFRHMERAALPFADEDLGLMRKGLAVLLGRGTAE